VIWLNKCALPTAKKKSYQLAASVKPKKMLFLNSGIIFILGLFLQVSFGDGNVD
jgi:hypothetical protein